MRRFMLLAVAIAGLVVAPGAIAADKKVEQRYLALYEKVDKENAGPYEDGLAGRNFVKDGVNTKNGSRPATSAELKEGIGVMERMLNPAPAVEYSATETTEYVEPTTSYSSGVSNATVMCESGGDYSINTGNGYYGGYQFDSQTWDAYGDSSYEEAHLAPPSVQDAAAASVPYDAWPNC